MSTYDSTFENLPAAAEKLPETTHKSELKVHRYRTVTKFHFEELKSEDGKSASRGVIRNHRSAAKKWCQCFGLKDNSPVGDELGVRFEESLARFDTYLQTMGNSKCTINSRKSMIRALRESYIDYMKLHPNSKNFAQALCLLIENSGKTIAEIARNVGIKDCNLYGWSKGEHYPSAKAVDQIHLLEDFFEVERGTLTSRFPIMFWGDHKFKSGTTPWRAHQQILTSPEKRYKMNIFPSLLQEEWDELCRCFTDLDYAKGKGLTLNSEWRIRLNTNLCPTAEVYLGKLSSFFGYLVLDQNSPDPMVRGKGFRREDLSLALLSNADLVIGHLRFMKGRCVTKTYNTGTQNELTFCLGLLRRKTGYLWQQHEFAERLVKPDAKQDQSPPMTKDKWRRWCERNAKKLIDFRNEIKEEQKRKNIYQGMPSKNRPLVGIPTMGKSKDGFTMTHHPFDAIMDLIRTLQHPITVIMNLATTLESFIPILKQGSPRLLALQRRHIFQTRMVGSNPLRVENYSMMTFIPLDWDKFVLLCKLYSERNPNEPVDFRRYYVETHESSNIYMNPDGSFGLRFNEEDFKNPQGQPLEAGMQVQPYDIPIVQSVYPSLMDYLFDGRDVLNKELKQRINALRAKANLPLLTQEEELAIERCVYVFRPDIRQLDHMSVARLTHYYGVEPMSTRALTLAMYGITQKYIPNCKGFCMNACRHFVATEYIRNNAEGEAVAAAALHSSVNMIRKHYAWARVADRIKPWQDYHEALHKALEEGHIREVA
jgi:hypothetical protein